MTEAYYVLTGRFPPTTIKVEDGYIVEAPEPISVLKWKRWHEVERKCKAWGWDVQTVEVLGAPCDSPCYYSF